MTFSLMCLWIAFMIQSWTLYKAIKRIIALEKANVFHHTRVTFISKTECESIREHNTEEWNREFKKEKE